MKCRLVAFGGRGTREHDPEKHACGVRFDARVPIFPQSANARRLRAGQAQPVSDVAMTFHPEVIAIEVKEALTKVGVVSSYDSDDGL
jgi:hypothetical protein